MNHSDWVLIDRRITERLLQFQKGSGGGPSLAAGVQGFVLGGDLAGVPDAAQVVGLYGVPLYGTPTDNQFWAYDAGNSRYAPMDIGSGALGDPGANGIVKRTALNTTAAALYGDVTTLFSGSGDYLKKDGTLATPAGTGDVVGPASATDGHLAVFDSTSGKLIKDGGAPGPGGGGILDALWGTLTIPVSTDFTWANQGSTTVTDETYGMWMSSPSQVAGARVLYKAAPVSLPYTIIFGAIPMFFPLSASAAIAVSAGWRQSSDGKMALAQVYNTGGFVFRVAKINGDGTYNSDYFAGSVNAWLVSPIVWIKLVEDSSNRTVYISNDRVHWQQIHQVGRTDWITADQVCVSVDDNGSGQPCGMFVLDWSVS